MRNWSSTVRSSISVACSKVRRSRSAAACHVRAVLTPVASRPAARIAGAIHRAAPAPGGPRSHQDPAMRRGGAKGETGLRQRPVKAGMRRDASPWWRHRGGFARRGSPRDGAPAARGSQGARHAIAVAASITLSARRRTSSAAFGLSETAEASRFSAASQAHERYPAVS